MFKLVRKFFKKPAVRSETNGILDSGFLLSEKMEIYFIDLMNLVKKSKV